MSASLAEIVDRFAGRRVLLVGDLILDRYIVGDAERISPEAPVLVLRVVEEKEAVGGSANVAACLRALGCTVACCGVVGDDARGRALLALMSDLGVDVSGVIACDQRRTTTKTRLVGLAQHRHRQQLMRVDEEDVGALAPETRRRLACAIFDQLSRAEVVCIEDYDKGVVNADVVRKIVVEAGRIGRQVLLDPARLNDFSRYRGVDVLTPNRAELSAAVGRSFTDLDDLADQGGKLAEALQIRCIVATVDRDGAILIRPGSPPRHFPTTPRTVYDNTGAGDAVLAMLAASLGSGSDLESATALANIAGGLEVEKFGCVPITADEVLAEIRLGRRRGGKLRSQDELLAEVGLRRDRGETIAFTNGCFDILHSGHVDYLRKSREHASMLVVGLNSDSSVRRQGKGDDRPINSFEDRATVLGALECVDYVVGFEEPDPESLIRRIRPDVLIKGEDWANKGVKGREFVEAGGGKVVLLPLVQGKSTTSIVERIRGLP